MKMSEHWLREWVDSPLSREELCESLTMAGLEIEDVQPVAKSFSGVVVGHVIHVDKHPEADRLHVCQVDVGRTDLLTIVCGAANVKPGMKVAAALDGATLSNKLSITTSKLRGVVSQGMLCSARELGLAEESEGIVALPADAPIGKSVWEYFNLDDYVIDVSITPNRGDCLSILGMATEWAAISQTKLNVPQANNVKSTITDVLPVTVKQSVECPRYVGRVIRQIKADAVSPIWLQERLRRGGIRCISPVVDVMNYVMLELGQPMHAFDLAFISAGIQVRSAKKGEQIKLLDGQTVALDEGTLLIADQEKPLAIAGVMGGLDSGVTLLTQDIFLESAYFNPESVVRSARRYQLGSESSYRFERGVDPELQSRAIERATELLLAITGGQPGPIIDMIHNEALPVAKTIPLRSARVNKIVGIPISAREVENILQRLGFVCHKTNEGWDIVVPARRFDITTEIDLIEEVVRIYGYNQIPLRVSQGELQAHPQSESRVLLADMRRLLCSRGYFEVVTYSFVDSNLLKLFDPVGQFKKLANPITSEMEVMRTTLWPGLVTTLIYNQNRQQNRIRIFETGLRFIEEPGSDLIQQPMLSGLISGDAFPEQWGMGSRPVDFFDVKGDLESLLHLTHSKDQFLFRPGTHPALHPGQTVKIYRNDDYVGIMGALHPSMLQALDLQGKVFVFELALDALEKASVPHFTEISKFPEIRRDLAILVDRTVPVQAIQDTIMEVTGSLLQKVNVFDIYEGKGVATLHKSVALSLTLQHPTRTLVDEEVASLMEQVIGALKEQFAAELRG